MDIYEEKQLRMEGGFFLMQHFDFVQGGRKIKGIEIIGHLQR